MTEPTTPRTEAGQRKFRPGREYEPFTRADILAIEAEVLEDVAERVRGLDIDPRFSGHIQIGFEKCRAAVLALLTTDRETT